MLSNSNAKHHRVVDVSDKKTLMIMSEHDEISNQLIDAKVGTTLLKLGKSGMLQELHITDQKIYNSMPLMLRATLRLPSGDNSREDEEFHQLF